MNFLAATLRLLGADSVRAVDVAVVDGAGAHVTGFDASRPANSATTTLAATTTDQELKAANPARRQFFIRNKANKTAYVHYGAAASAVTHNIVIAAGGYYESQLNGYTGSLHAILAAGTGDIDITEVTT